MVSNHKLSLLATAVVDHDVAYEIAGGRDGDPDVLVVDSNKAREVLGWVPGYTDIKEIISTAWDWVI